MAKNNVISYKEWQKKKKEYTKEMPVQINSAKKTEQKAQPATTGKTTTTVKKEPAKTTSQKTSVKIDDAASRLLGKTSTRTAKSKRDDRIDSLLKIGKEEPLGKAASSNAKRNDLLSDSNRYKYASAQNSVANQTGRTAGTGWAGNTGNTYRVNNAARMNKSGTNALDAVRDILNRNTNNNKTNGNTYDEFREKEEKRSNGGGGSARPQSGVNIIDAAGSILGKSANQNKAAGAVTASTGRQTTAPATGKTQQKKDMLDRPYNELALQKQMEDPNSRLNQTYRNERLRRDYGKYKQNEIAEEEDLLQRALQDPATWLGGYSDTTKEALKYENASKYAKDKWNARQLGLNDASGDIGDLNAEQRGKRKDRIQSGSEALRQQIEDNEQLIREIQEDNDRFNMLNERELYRQYGNAYYEYKRLNGIKDPNYSIIDWQNDIGRQNAQRMQDLLGDNDAIRKQLTNNDKDLEKIEQYDKWDRDYEKYMDPKKYLEREKAEYEDLRRQQEELEASGADQYSLMNIDNQLYEKEQNIREIEEQYGFLLDDEEDDSGYHQEYYNDYAARNSELVNNQTYDTTNVDVIANWIGGGEWYQRWYENDGFERRINDNFSGAEVMTDDEKNQFMKLYNNARANGREPVEAKAFLDALQPYLNERLRPFEELQNTANAAQYPAMMSAMTGLESTVTALPQMVATGIGNLFGMDFVKDPNSDIFAATRASRDTESQVANMLGPVGGFIYKAGMSGYKNLLRGLMYGGLGGAAEAATLTQFFGEAFNQSYVDKLEETKGDAEASGAYALVDAAISTFFEIASIEKMYSDPTDYMQYVIQNVGAEMSEEAFEAIFGPYMHKLLDGSDQWNDRAAQIYDNYIKQGMYQDETGKWHPVLESNKREVARLAQKQAMQEWNKEILENTLSAAISTGGAAAYGGIKNLTNDTRTGNWVLNQNKERGMSRRERSGLQMDNALKLVNPALAMPVDTQSHKLAQQIENDLKEGKKISPKAVGQLTTAIVNESNEQIGKIAQDVLGESFLKTLKTEGVGQKEAADLTERLVRVVTRDVGSTEEMLQDMLIISETPAAQQILAEYGDSEARKRFMQETEAAKTAQKSVMEIITGTKESDITTDTVSGMMAGAKAATAEDIAEANAQGTRSGSALEVIADGIYGDITGFMTENVKGEDGKNQTVVKVQIGTGAAARTVDISQVKGLTDGAAQVLQVISRDRGQVIGNETAKALLQIAGKTKDLAGTIADSMKIMWSAAMEQKAPKTGLDAETETQIRDAVQADMDAAEERRVANWRQIKPGQGTTTYNGYAYGTKEFNDELNKLGKTHRNEANVIGNYAKSMGMDVELYYDENESAKQGAFFGGKAGAGIRINLAGTINREGAHRSAVATFAHEYTHGIEANSPTAYKALRTFVLQNMEKNGYNLQDELKHIMDNYEAHGESIDMSGAIAELVAMGSEEVLTNEELAAQMKEQDETLYGKTQHAINRLLKQLRGVRGDVLTTSSRYARAMRNVGDQLAKIWTAAYEEAKGTTAPAEITSETKTLSSWMMNPEEHRPQTINIKRAINNPTKYNNYFTYDNLIKKDPIRAIQLEPIDSNKTRRDILDNGMANAKKYGQIKNGEVFVHVYDAGTDVRITEKGLRHDLNDTEKDQGIIERIGEVLQEAVVVNTSSSRTRGQDGQYKLLGAAVNSDGKGITYALIAVNKITNTVERVDTLKSVRSTGADVANNKKTGATGARASADNSVRLTVFPVKIADALKDVKDIYNDVLPTDVLNHFNVQRKITKDTPYLQHSFSDENTIRDSEGEVLAEVLPGGTITKYSWASWQNEDIEELTRQLIEKGFDKKDVTKWIKDVNGVAAMIAANRDVLDYEASPYFTMLKNNQEYVKTLDASTLCAKRLLYQGIFNEIQHLLPNTPIMPDDLIKLVNMMKKRGLVTPCGICYVESRRRMLGKYAQQWLESYEGEYKPKLEEVTTTDGLERLRDSHPQTYQDFVDAMNAKGSANPKVVQLRTDYRGEIKKMTDSQITKVKEIGGLRVQSFSDFEIVHMIDMMQAVMDMAAMDLTSQAYTKVPEFAWVFGDTGIKINLSLIGEGNGLDENGNLIFSSTEGMDFDEAMALRKRYSKNVGTILVGMNDAHVIAAMGDSRIDFIIPFHKSGWSKKEMARVSGMSVYKDYTRWQNEKKLGDYSLSGYKTIPNKKSKIRNLEPVGPNGYWVFSKTGTQNAEEYLRICKEDGRVPKFANFLTYNGDGSFSLPAGNDQRSQNIRNGYWKLLIDFKMYDNNGVGSPQTTVQPKFNMQKAKDILNNYDGSVRELPTDHELAKEFAEEYKAEHPGRKVFSIQDDRYEDAVNNGDTDLAQWMVDMAAEAAMENSKVRGKDGKLLKMYHGTNADFNVFEREYIGSTGRFEGSGFNFTPYEGRASSYGKNVLAGYLNIQKPLSAEKKTISVAKLAQIIREADPTGDYIIADYARNTRDYGSESFVQRESLTAARNIWESSDNDVDIYSFISAADSDAESLIAKFQQLGYDGLIHYDDNGNIKTAIAFDSNQFKRADPATYDDNNKLIPLSERFSTEKKDIRWSIQDDMDQDVRTWMLSMNEFNLRTEAERILLRQFKGLDKKVEIQQEKERNLTRQIKELEEIQRKNERGETVKTGEPIENALENAGLFIQFGKHLVKNGTVVGEMTSKNALKLNSDADSETKGDLIKAGFRYNEDEDIYVYFKKGGLAAGSGDIAKRLQDLRIRLQNARLVKEQTQEKLGEITGSEGYARMMREQSQIYENYMFGKTQSEVTEAVNRLRRSADRIAADYAENRRIIAEMGKKDAMQEVKKILESTTVKEAAAALQREYHSSWKQAELMPYISNIMAKMAAGEDFTGDIEELAVNLISSDTRQTYEGLAALRGLTITIGRSELKAKGSSISEIRQQLEGTGIIVKTGKNSTLDKDISDLRTEYPNMPEFDNNLNALDEFVAWVNGMRGDEQGEFFEQKKWEAVAKITQKIGQIADRGLLYIPNDSKAKQQIMDLIGYMRELKERNEASERLMAQIAEQMDELKKAGSAAAGMAGVLNQHIGEALEYYDRTAKIAVQQAKQNRQEAIIQQLTSEYAKKIIKNNEEWRALIERDKEARDQLDENHKRRGQISVAAKRMYNLLTKPQGTKNIPEHMQGLAREVLGMLLNNDIAEGGRKLTQITKKQLSEAARVLTALDLRDGKPDLSGLQEMEDSNFAAMVINQDLMNIRDGIEDYNREWRGKNKLDTLKRFGEILTNVQEAVSEIYSYIRAENEIQIRGRKINVEDQAYKIAKEIGNRQKKEWTGKMGIAISGLHRAIISGNMTPEYFFRTIGNEGLSDLWDGYHEAENRNGLELAKAKAKLEEIADRYGYDKWDLQQKVTLDLESGQQVQMTIGQLMSLWATWNREMELGPEMSEHLAGGGFFAEQDTRDGLLGKTVMEKRAHRISVERDESGRITGSRDMQRVAAMLTDEQKDFVNDVVGFMSRDMSELGNEASMKAYGIKMYKEKYYFPFQMWDGVRSRKSNDAGGAAAAQDRAFHPSFSKSRMHGANNALVIGDFMRTVTDHVAGMINYATMGLANENMQKVLNQQLAESNGADEINKRNIWTKMEEAYGREAMQYLRELQVQLNGGAVRTSRSLGDKAISIFRKNAVAGSLSVALQQPLSYIRAAMLINPKYLTKAAMTEYWKDSYTERMKYSGVSVIKEMGRFDMALGQSAREYLTPDGKESTGRKIWEGVKEYSTILPELMDRWTWNRMWVAVKAEQAALHPEMDVKSEAFLQMVGERFNELMRRTQVYDSVLVKSANMRSDNYFVKSMTSFMAEPTLTINVLADAVRSAKQGEKGGKALLAKAGATFILSAVLQSVFKALMSTGRTPDEKKTWWENFLYRFFGNFQNEVDPLQLIPGYSDAITLLKDGKLQDDAMGAFGKLFTAGQKGVDLLLGNGKNGWYRDMEDSVGQLTQLFSGLPLKNLMRDARAMWNWAIDQPYAERDTDWNIVKFQTIDTFMNADNLFGVLMEKLESSGYDTSNAGYYQRIYEAKKAGNKEAAQDMIDYLLNGKGVKEKTISDKMAALAKEDDSMSAEETAGFLMDNGKDPTSYIKDQLKEGKMTAEDARKMLQEADPKKSEDDVWWAVDRIQYQLDNGLDKAPGGSYYRLWDAMDNNSTEEIRTALNAMTGHGVQAKNIKTQITKQYKDDYLKADSNGKRKIRDAIQKAYKLLGLTAEDADKIINKWGKDKDNSSKSGGGGGGAPTRMMQETDQGNEFWDQMYRHTEGKEYGLGNIDLNHRKVVHNPDGSISTEYSITVGYDDGIYVLPTVINGKIVSEDEAIEHFEKTGEYLGRFDTDEEADDYAWKLHERQEWYYTR